MPKIRITGLPKAKNGMTTNGPCQSGYIKVDGECIPESAINFTIYQSGKDEYSRTNNGPQKNVNINSFSSFSKCPPGSGKIWNGTACVCPEGFQDIMGYGCVDANMQNVASSTNYKATQKKIKQHEATLTPAQLKAERTAYNKQKQAALNDPNVTSAVSDLLNSKEKDNSIISRLARGRDIAYATDFTKNLGPVVGTGLNWMRNVMYAPGSGAVTLAQMLRGDQNLTENNPNANTQAALDVTGMSNYPYLQKSIDQTGQAYSDLWNNPSWGNLGNASMSTIGTALNTLGSLPIIAPIEGGIAKMTEREIPTLTSKLAPSFTKKSLAKTFKVNPHPTNFAQFVTNTPIINEGVGVVNQGLHTMDNVMGAPYRALKETVNPLLNKTGFQITEGASGAAPWIFGEHMWEGATGSNPIQDAQNYLLQPKANYPASPDSGLVYKPSTMPSTYSENNANLISKDTTINLQSPSGKIYTIKTGSPQFQQLTGLINRNSNNYDSKTQTFKLNKGDFKSKGQEVDIDEFMDAFLPKQAYGGMNEIPSLFKYSPERNAPGRMEYGGIPKFIEGGTPPNCDPGYMVDPNNPDACIEDPNYIPNVGITPTDKQIRSGQKSWKNNLVNTAPDNFSKDYSNMKLTPTIDQTGMTGGFDWNQGNTDIQGNSTVPAAPVNPDATAPVANPNYNKNMDVGLFKCPKGQIKDQKTGQCVPDTRIKNGLNKFSNTYNRITTPLAMLANQWTNIGRQNDFDTKSREARFNNQPVANTNHGLTEDPNNGLRRNNYGQIGYKWNNQASGYGNVEFGGEPLGQNGIRIRLTGGPVDNEYMAYGGQSGYGFDLGQRNTYAAMPQGKQQTVSKQIEEVPRHEANIEAEKGETIYGDIDNDGADEHMNIGGKRHVDGGTPLNVPEGSFVFSDTKDMRIKDEASLAKFGLLPRKEGYTPAEIAKKYDINKYKAIIEDESSDELMKSTAQLMVKNYQKKLAELALIQESIKGFPQGIPDMCRGILPDEMLDQIEQQIEQQKGEEGQQGGEGQQPQPGAPEPNGVQEYAEGQEPVQDDEGAPGDAMQDQMIDEEEAPGMMYGGDFAYGGDASYDRMINEDLGNIPKYKVAGTVKPKPGDADYDYMRGYIQLEDLMNDPKNAGLRTALYNQYKTHRGASDTISEEDYIKDLLEAQKQKYQLHYFLKSHPEKLTTHDWDTGGENAYYNKIAQQYGFTPQTKEQIIRSQNAYKDFADLSLNDANFKKTYGNQFGLSGIGVQDEDAYRGITMTEPKGWRGNTDIGQLFYLNNDQPADTSVFGYICKGRPNDVPDVEEKTYATEADRTAAGAFPSRAEAEKSCPPGSTTIIPGKKFKCSKDAKGNPIAVESTIGFDSAEEALKHCPGKDDIPFDYMTPDKWKMNAVRNRRINKYLPFVADVPYEAANYLPEEWRAKAAELQSQTNDAARAMGAMGPAQGFAANLSAIQGKQARNLVGAIADVDARNVQGYNAFNQREIARKDQFNALRAANQNERYKGNVIANQNYDNAMNKQMMDIADTDSNAWLNRMQLDMENQTNKNYFTDPWQGRLHFRKGKSVNDLGTTTDSDPDAFRKWQEKNKGVDGTYPTYSDYIKAQGKKYGGPINKKQNNSGTLGEMLSRGYSFPF
jgi:hypothetical protein